MQKKFYMQPVQFLSLLLILRLFNKTKYPVVFFIISFSILIFHLDSLAVTSGAFRSYTTLYSMGMEWDVGDDANHNSSCQVQYKTSTSLTWKTALPLYRVDFNGANMMAGSIFFLKPGTTYDVKLTLSDPDGGSFFKTFSIQTRSVPKRPSNGRKRYVIPGAGGGTGTFADPFQGIDAAQSNALPGDIFFLRPGTYSGETEFTASGNPGNYILWEGGGDGLTILQALRINADHIWIEGVHVTGLQMDDKIYGLRTYNAPEDIIITGNSFNGCTDSIYLNHGGTGWYIADNIIEGSIDPSSGSFSGEGIELNHSDDHTVAYNLISRVADGISYPNRNCDIFGNDIFDVSDDGIEGDYGYANIRIWGNRISNALHNGISFQPMNGAPWYVFRNQVAAPMESAMKFRDAVDRALIAHNTFVGWQGAQKSGSNYLVNVQSNNNLYISATDWYAWENTSGGLADWKTDLDYDGFDWGTHVYGFKWGGSNRYADITDFSIATGFESHGIQVDKSAIFENYAIPDSPPAAMPRQFMTLKPGCNAQDAGIVLPNINDDYLGTAPDLGAYEIGAPLPRYGPGKSSKESIAPILIPLLLQ